MGNTRKEFTTLIKCCLCGAELSSSMIFYDNKANRYCYDCFEKISRKPAIRRKPMSEEQMMSRKIKAMYKRGDPPSAIAKKMHISAKRVYAILNGEKT